MVKKEIQTEDVAVSSKSPPSSLDKEVEEEIEKGKSKTEIPILSDSDDEQSKLLTIMLPVIMGSSMLSFAISMGVVNLCKKA